MWSRPCRETRHPLPRRLPARRAHGRSWLWARLKPTAGDVVRSAGEAGRSSKRHVSMGRPNSALSIWRSSTRPPGIAGAAPDGETRRSAGARGGQQDRHSSHSGAVRPCNPHPEPRRPASSSMATWPVSRTRRAAHAGDDRAGVAFVLSRVRDRHLLVVALDIDHASAPSSRRVPGGQHRGEKVHWQASLSVLFTALVLRFDTPSPNFAATGRCADPNRKRMPGSSLARASSVASSSIGSMYLVSRAAAVRQCQQSTAISTTRARRIVSLLVCAERHKTKTETHRRTLRYCWDKNDQPDRKHPDGYARPQSRISHVRPPSHVRLMGLPERPQTIHCTAAVLLSPHCSRACSPNMR